MKAQNVTPFEQMVAAMRQRLRPTKANLFANQLRIYVGLDCLDTDENRLLKLLLEEVSPSLGSQLVARLLHNVKSERALPKPHARPASLPTSPSRATPTVRNAVFTVKPDRHRIGSRLRALSGSSGSLAMLSAMRRVRRAGPRACVIGTCDFLHETRTHNEDNYYICVTAKSGSRMYTALV